MDTKKEAKKYLNKYFKAQYLKETDDEYKSLVRLLNKALRIHDVVGRSEQFYCTCSRAKGLDYDEEGTPYCISCQKEVQ